MKRSRHPVSFRLTTLANQLLTEMANDKGISKAAMIEIIIREAAKREGLNVDRPEDEDDDA